MVIDTLCEGVPESSPLGVVVPLVCEVGFGVAVGGRELKGGVPVVVPTVGVP